MVSASVLAKAPIAKRVASLSPREKPYDFLENAYYKCKLVNKDKRAAKKKVQSLEVKFGSA